MGCMTLHDCHVNIFCLELFQTHIPVDNINITSCSSRGYVPSLYLFYVNSTIKYYNCYNNTGQCGVFARFDSSSPIMRFFRCSDNRNTWTEPFQLFSSTFHGYEGIINHYQSSKFCFHSNYSTVSYTYFHNCVFNTTRSQVGASKYYDCVFSRATDRVIPTEECQYSSISFTQEAPWSSKIILMAVFFLLL